jgi:hypothetical protein
MLVLSPYHVNKDSTAWQRRCPPDKQTLYHIDSCAAQRKMCMGVLNGTIPSAVSNTGATLSPFHTSDPSLPTGRVSSAVFHLPNGAIALATTINKLLHDVRAPTQDVNIVPSLVGNSLLSISKLAKAGYSAMYNKDKVNFYDTHTTKITVLADVVLKGWQ